MKWIHNLLKCFSFSAVLFTFQACYGGMEDEIYDCDFSIRVIDGDGNGIPNVEVSLINSVYSIYSDYFFVDTTNTAGLAYVKIGIASDISLKFQLKPLNGVDFQAKDTAIEEWKPKDTFFITLQPK